MNKTSTFLFSYNVFHLKSISKTIALFCMISFLFTLSDSYNIYGYGYITSDINSLLIDSKYINNTWFFNLFHNSKVIYAYYFLVFIYIAYLLFVILNYNQLTFSIISWVIHLSFINSSQIFSYGADFFITLMLFFNVLFSFTLILKNQNNQKIIQSAIFRLLQIHLSIAYFFTGFGKALGNDWFNGEAMYIVLNNAMPAMFHNITNMLFYKILGWTVILLECLYPVLIIFKSTRKATLILIILMHLSIIVFLKLYTFGAVMILLNIIAFYNSIRFKEKYSLYVFYDNYCPNCTRFINIVQQVDWFHLIKIRQLRKIEHINNAKGINKTLSLQQMASSENFQWTYGYNTIFKIFLRIPLAWVFLPIMWILKITRIGQYLYTELAVKRKIIPLHCTKDQCNI